MLKVLTALIVMLTFVAGCGESPATPQASGVPDGIQQRPSTKPVAATTSRSDEASDVPNGPSAGPRDVSWKQIGQLIGHSQPIKTLAFLPDSDRLVSGSFDGTLKVWDTTTLQEVKSIKAHDGDLSMFALSPDGKRLASGDFGGTEKNLIKVWDTNTWNCVATSRAGSTLYCIAFSPDGATLATTGGKAIEFWRITEQRELKRFKQIDVGIWPISGLAFSPDGRTLFLAGMDNIDNTFAAGEGTATWSRG